MCTTQMEEASSLAEQATTAVVQMSDDPTEILTPTEEQQQQQQNTNRSFGLRRRRRRKQSSRRYYTQHKPALPTPAQEALFLTMRQRQLQRTLNGARKQASIFQAIALLAILASLFGVGVSSYNDGTLTTTLQIQFWQLLLTGCQFVLCSVVLSTFAESTYFETLLYLLVYWPLLATIATLVLRGSTYIRPSSTWIFIAFITAECLTLVLAICRHYLYPRLLQAKFFRPTSYWSVRVIADDTFTYNPGHKRRRRATCMYQGEHDATGRPHGWGSWRDDAGEVCTGRWREGVPVAPLRSRVGGAAAVRAVPVGCVLATDDTLTHNRFFPSNQRPARAGLASVECSVQGAFYKHLPRVTMVREPGEDVTVAECAADAAMSGPQHDDHVTTTAHHKTVTIEAHAGGGVQVLGHVYTPTGLPYAEDTDAIVVEVERDEPTGEAAQAEASQRLQQEPQPPDLCMPYSAMSSSMDEMVFLPVDSTTDGSRDANDDDEVDDDEEGDVTGDTSATLLMDSLSSVFADRLHPPRLKVKNWIASPQKEALIYFSGFKATLEKSLKNFGQFLAMTQVSDHVFPIVFAWPGGHGLTYRHAAKISASERNMELFLDLMRDLQAAGIRHVHFMSHSMGVQTLLNALHDTPDGERSPVSKLFRLHHDFGGRGMHSEIEDDDDADHRMLCKSIILVNPDFPVEAFVNHTYLPLRRICGNITVIGDQSDQALYISQFCNGMFNLLGYSQPRILYKTGQTPTAEELRKRRGVYRYQRVIGRDFHMLHLPHDKQRRQSSSGDVEAPSRRKVDKRLLFKVKTPMFVGADPTIHERQWLDIDVIDTTNLDANIMGLYVFCMRRHELLVLSHPFVVSLLHVDDTAVSTSILPCSKISRN